MEPSKANCMVQYRYCMAVFEENLDVCVVGGSIPQWIQHPLKSTCFQ